MEPPPADGDTPTLEAQEAPGGPDPWGQTRANHCYDEALTTDEPRELPTIIVHLRPASIAVQFSGGSGNLPHRVQLIKGR
jgi:hypothetical protein